MEAVDEEVAEEVAEIPVDVAPADEPEGYMVMIDNFVMEAVDEVAEEVADIPADVAVAGEPEGYPVQTSQKNRAIVSKTAVTRIPITMDKTDMLAQRS
ncbi:hypothetical protein ARMGADRAFT_1021749 [Armillaria gallica]|uniref:Uncharacterized protein n=1 Tax=Armillaria gallica TaxID=47427 RepID=A0A2H3C7M0_ARMGA|nr:hypothetical protein ARMGADRAFT_1021749 [Armillaria gallica]